MQEADALILRVLETLNEAQARWYVAREALARGRGGLKAMHALTGLSRPTILKGIRELQHGTRLNVEGVRAPGGGRKRVLLQATPAFLNRPTSSFFFVSTLTTGLPARMNR